MGDPAGGQPGHTASLLVERQGDVALVTLNRPEVLNAIDTQLGRQLLDLLEGLVAPEGSPHCVVLTGAGTRAFCAGGDLKQRKGMTEKAWKAQHAMFERLMRALVDCPVPLIGAVNGIAYGGGCEIAACCDFLYAARSARFALPEVGLGIMPGGGGTQTLPRAMGERRAKELLMSGRPFSAEQAMAWGLVNEVLDAEQMLHAALATAHEIARHGPVVARRAKQSIALGMRLSLGDGLAFEIEASNRLVSTKGRAEGSKASTEKPRPSFEGS